MKTPQYDGSSASSSASVQAVPLPAGSALTMREKAEAIVLKQEAEAARLPGALPPADPQQMLHELRVHQIELEMQNEELRRAQVELEASRLRYFDLYDLAPVGYLTLSEEGLIEQANFTSAALLGVGRKSLVGQSITRFVLSEDQDIMYLRRRQLRASREPQSFELRMIKGGCSIFWAHLEGTAALAPDGAPTHRLVLSDITGRIQAEQEKAQLEAQLQQAQKMEAVGRLAGGVAHDFNNMLAVVIADTELALTQVQPGQQLHADLTEILKAARRSADLTRQLLAFARKQTIAPKVLDLNEAMAGMISLLRRLLGEDVNLTWQPEGSLWPVLMDPSQLDQLLANLCINARDSIANVGSVSINAANSIIDAEFCAHHGDAVPGEYVRLSITDTGCGMDVETLAHIFEPFFTTKPLGEGTGLGLATVYGAVKQNSGFVTVVSEPGSGTTFSVYLPRHLGRADVVEVAPPPALPKPGKETILVVEDEASILKVALRLLKAQGYNVLGAATPAEAIRIAQEHDGRIDLLLTDVIMPGMNGRELANALLSFAPRLKTLFMSGYTADVMIHRGVLDEKVHFIQKPFAIASMAAAVKLALDS